MIQIQMNTKPIRPHYQADSTTTLFLEHTALHCKYIYKHKHQYICKYNYK